MPLFTAETITVGIKMFILVICAVVGTLVIGVVCSTLMPIGEETGIGTHTTPLYNYIPLVIGGVLVLGAVSILVNYFLAAHRKEYETYYREDENDYLYRR